MRELNKNAWVFEMTVDESCKNVDDIEDIIRQSNGTIIGLRGRNHIDHIPITRVVTQEGQ